MDYRWSQIYRNADKWITKLSGKYFNGKVPDLLDRYLGDRYCADMAGYDHFTTEDELAASIEKDFVDYASGWLDKAVLVVIGNLLGQYNDKEDEVLDLEYTIGVLKEALRLYDAFLIENGLTAAFLQWKKERHADASAEELESLANKEDLFFDVMEG